MPWLFYMLEKSKKRNDRVRKSQFGICVILVKKMYKKGIGDIS